ncbi:MAG: hypothetical protein ACREU9_03585 [Gammaproteobacteria bacterium]
MLGESNTIDLNDQNVPKGASCWAKAHPVGANNHESGDNFDYGGVSAAQYTLTGGALNLSFALTNPYKGMTNIL